MSDRIRSPLVLAFPVLGVLLVGCITAPPSHITLPVVTREPESRIAGVIGLYVSPETKAVVLKDEYFTNKWKGAGSTLDIGLALEPGAQDSLAKLFSEVILASAPTDTRQPVLELRVDDRSHISFGPSTLSPKTVQLTLVCTLRSGAGQVLWEDTVTGTASRTSKAAYLSIIIIMRGWMFRKFAEAVGQAGDEALAKCLDNLNELLLEQRALFR